MVFPQLKAMDVVSAQIGERLFGTAFREGSKSLGHGRVQESSRDDGDTTWAYFVNPSHK